MERFKESNAVDGSVKIRNWIKDDVPQVSEIAEAAMPFPWSEKFFYDCLKSNYYGWVMESDHHLVGFIVILMQEKECQLMDIAVAPRYQRKGVASQLLQHALHYAKTHHATRLLLEVRKSNRSAIEFYKKAGGVEIGVRKNYYPAEKGREDALVFNLNF